MHINIFNNIEHVNPFSLLFFRVSALRLRLGVGDHVSPVKPSGAGARSINQRAVPDPLDHRLIPLDRNQITAQILEGSAE